MKALFSMFAILNATPVQPQKLPRDEGHVWTTPQDSTNGSFIFPRTYPLTFREGSSINISWSKKYENINLYFYQRGKVAKSVQLLTNFATDWYEWEAHAEETNLTNPFVFRIVNAQGTVKEQSGGGFWSTSWYLARDESASSSVTPPSSPTAASASPLPLPSSLSSPSATTTTATSSALPSSPVASSESPSPATREIRTEGTTASSVAAETHDTGVGKGAVIGLTVGLVITSIIIVGGLLHYLKRRRSSKGAFVPASLSASYHEKAHIHKQSGHLTVHEAYTYPSELQGETLRYELSDKR